MKLSWNSLKISIAGARLTHLAQKDRIWDHGTMVEQVRNVFYKIEKAKQKNDLHSVRNNLTGNARAQITRQLAEFNQMKKSFLRNVVVTEVAILDVNLRTEKNPDRFTALIKGKRQPVILKDPIPSHKQKRIDVENFSERWRFCRDGDWWLLDDIKKRKLF